MSLRCDVCGGTEFVKSDHFFQCEKCKMKYSLEDVRVMIGDSNQDIRLEAESLGADTTDSDFDADAKPNESTGLDTAKDDADSGVDNITITATCDDAPRCGETREMDTTTGMEDGEHIGLTKGNASLGLPPEDGPESANSPLFVQLLWSEGKKEFLQAEIRDPGTGSTFCYSTRMRFNRKQDEREFCNKYADRIERDLKRQVEYAIPPESIQSRKRREVSTRIVLLVGVAFFAIGYIADITNFEAKFIGLSVQMCCVILYSILLVRYFQSHRGRLARALTIAYWSFACLACVLQVHSWVENKSFTLFRLPYEGTSVSKDGEKTHTYSNDVASGNSSSTDSTPTAVEERKPFLETLRALGEFEETTIEGAGDNVVQIPCGPIPCLITIVHGGDSNFAVKSYDANGNYTDLLVNTIGNYIGQVTTYFDYADSAQLEVKASGNWAMTFKPMSAMTRVEPDDAKKYNGGIFRGDYVVYIDEKDINGLGFLYLGDSNFSVKAVAPTAQKLLVNTIGEYKGTVIWNEPQSFFVVHADGNWGLVW